MATIRPNGVNQFLDLNGRPLAGGWVETFASGTSTHLATFNDAAEQSPKSNPFQLDASGRATIFWSGSYKVVITSADGSEVDTIDPLNDSASDGDAAAQTLRTDLASTADATKSAALIGLPPRDDNDQPTTVGNWIVGKISPASRFGVVQDGRDNTAALQRAAATGRYIEFVEGDMLVGATIALSAGGFFGVGGDQVGTGPKTRFLRNFSGGPVIWNNYGGRVKLRDFYVGSTASAYASLVEGDNGVQMGQGSNRWQGSDDLTNLFIQGQYRGMLIFNGALATIMAPQIEYCKNDAITTVDGACSLINYKLQFNAGNGIGISSTNPSSCNLTLSNGTTYYNGGKSIYGPNTPGVHAANLWAERHCSSFDNGGGVFLGNIDQVKMTSLFVEYSGGGGAGPTNPFTGSPVNWGTNASASGVVLTDGTADAQLIGVHALYCQAAGVTLHGTTRTTLVGLDALDNGLAYGAGAPARSGLVIQNGNVGLNLSGINAKGGYSDGAAHSNTFAQLYGVTVSTNDNSGLLNGVTIDRYAEEVPQTSGALRISNVIGVTAPTITAAYTIAIPLVGDTFAVSGGTNVQQISPSWTGRRVNLTLDLNNKIVRGVNVKLNGSDFVGAAGASIDLQYDGSAWQERGRWVNA